MNQKSFDLQPTASYAEEDWIATDSNAEAYGLVTTATSELPSPLVALYGAEGVGKTHLAHIWAVQCNAAFITRDALVARDSAALLADALCIVLEDVNMLTSEPEQTALFHLINEVKLTGKTLLITTTLHPTKLNIALPDLASRLAGFTAIGIDAPDDMLLEALLMKQFSDKQLKVSADVMSYILSRSQRSCASIKMLVDTIDAAALAQKRNITVPFVREIMQGKLF